MKEHEGNPNCKHEWVYSPEVIATNPPIRIKICKKCGRVEEEKGTFYDAGEFHRIYDKFHGGAK